MRTKILLCAAGLWAALAQAEVPAGYYDDCEGLSKAALKSQLSTIVKNHTRISYGNGSNQTWGVYIDTDAHPDGYWWDIYTTNKVPVGDGSAANNNVMNKEHCFPKSWWGGNTNDAYCDIMHLMPVNSVANSTRGNMPYGEVAKPKSISNKCPNPRFKHGTPVAGQGGGSGTVFEPDDEFKGDLARTYFYMVTCYQDLTWKESGLYTAKQGTYPTLQDWAIEMLLRWHREDPVSQKELDRNEAVYKHQHNRNPFIDYPEMVEYIWGDKMDKSWTFSGGSEEPDPVDPDPEAPAKLTSPIQGDWYTFATVKPGSTATLKIPVIGAGFTHSLTAQLSDDKYSFQVGSLSLNALSIKAGDVEAEDVYYLTVVYSPTVVTPEGADDNATLTISSQDLETPVTVNLQGHCVAPMELEAVTVLPVEDLTEAGYTLRWLPTALEPDTYTVTRKIYDEQNNLYDTLTYDVDGSETSLKIDDRDPSKHEALSVKAYLGDAESPDSNEVMVQATNSLSDISVEAGKARYFDAHGYELPGLPDTPGVYVVRVGSHTAKTVIIK
ncbi:MAG: endonuclease [Muribaculaceae bacterium]|nr:endonuclease [Muribaculaceae bacterium]